MTTRLTLKHTPAIVRLLDEGRVRIPDMPIGSTFLVNSFTDSVDGQTVNCHVRDYRCYNEPNGYCVWTVRLGRDCEEVEPPANKLPDHTDLLNENTKLRARLDHTPIFDYTVDNETIPDNDPVVLAELAALPTNRLCERLRGVYDLHPGKTYPRRFYTGALDHEAARRIESLGPSVSSAVQLILDRLTSWGDQCCGGAGDKLNPATGKRYGEEYYSAAAVVRRVTGV